ncbi:MAG: hypothetical protein PHV82_13385 [Victivallaceae bacterium]|nr:hypothetical protein [Victivallaceae bacterium]
MHTALVIRNISREEQAAEDKKFRKSQTPEYRLDALEKLRLEAENFL